MARVPKHRLNVHSRRFMAIGRMLGFLLGMLVVALAVSSAIYIGLRPFINGEESQKKLDALSRTVEGKRSERDELRTRIDWMKSPEGAFELGRRKGLVKPGEHAVRVEVVPPEPATAAPAAPPQDAASIPYLGIAALFALAFGVGVLWLLLRRRATPDPHPAGVLTPRSELNRRRHDG